MDDHAVAEYVRLWDVQPVPMRPSQQGLQHYRSVMERTPNPSVLILGGTPELADLAVSMHCRRVVRFDISGEILQGMRKLARCDWSGVELVVGDWLQPQEAFEGRFDCMLCDGGPLFLEFPRQWASLFRQAFSSLRPGGCFCFKGQAHPEDAPTFEALRDRKIGHFNANARGLGPEQQVAQFWHLVAHLWQACFLGLVAPDGGIDKAAVSKRMDETGWHLMDLFPEEPFRSIAQEGLHAMLRCADRMPVLEYLPPSDRVIPCLIAAGFQVEPVVFLADSEPFTGYCYQATAIKPVGSQPT